MTTDEKAPDTRIAELLAADEQRARDISRLTVERDEARDRLATTQSELDELREAGQKVMDGLNARIDAAPETAVPVFNGIVDLHDALSRAATRTAGGEDERS